MLKKYPVPPLTRPLAVTCVLRTGGGTYDARYVNALAAGVKKHLSLEHKFVCLTDDPKGFSSNVDEVISLKHDYPGWWSKIELFRPDILKDHQIFFLDLDTVIVGSIDEIASYGGDFAGLRDFFRIVTLGSGIMSWKQGNLRTVYTDFIKNPRMIMNNMKGGDQQWIEEKKITVDYFQDMFYKQIVSYKKDCTLRGSRAEPIIAETAKIVCFHGIPKPHQIRFSCIKDHWNPKN